MAGSKTEGNTGGRTGVMKSLMAFLRTIVWSMGLSFSKEKYDKYNRYVLTYQAYEAIKRSVYEVRHT